MSWLDRFRTGSFRGVQFFVESHSGSFGRKQVNHEFPERDKPFTEDLGRQARAFNIEGYLIGEDYDLDRNKLIEAIEKAGAGELIHPYLGTFQVIARPSSFTEVRTEGRMCRFSLQFVEAGEAFFPTTAVNNTSQIDDSVLAIIERAIDHFFERFSVDNVQSYVEGKAKEIFGDSLNRLSGIRDAVEFTQEGLSTFERLRGKIEDNLGEITTDYTSLIDDFNGIFGLFDSEATNQRNVSIANNTFFDYSSNFPDPEGFITNGNAAVIRNNQAQTELMEIFAIGAASKAANRAALIENDELRVVNDPAQLALQPDSDDTGYDSIEDAIIARDAIGEAMDGITASTDDDDTFSNIETLRGELFTAVPGEDNNLASIVDVRLNSALPSVVMAHGIYGTAQLDGDLVKINNPVHPGFMPFSRDLKARLL